MTLIVNEDIILSRIGDLSSQYSITVRIRLYAYIKGDICFYGFSVLDYVTFIKVILSNKIIVSYLEIKCFICETSESELNSSLSLLLQQFP